MIESIACRSAVVLPDTALGEFMYMPGGLHQINAWRGDKPVKVQVLVDQGSAAAVQKQFSQIRAGIHRPYFDFDHDSKKASFWPEAFVWREQPAPGIYAQGEWTSEGKEAIEGKTYRAFSPEFHVDDVNGKPARIVCNEKAGLNFGGLVNDPAFKQILPLWAKAGAQMESSETENEERNAMTPEQLAALQASIKTMEQEITALKAKASTDAAAQTELKAKESDKALAEAKLQAANAEAKAARFETQIKAQREKEADEAVKAAVARGAILPKDEAFQAKWKAIIMADPTSVELLNACESITPIGQGRITSQGVKITREDSAAVIKAYASEKDYKLRGKLYKQISARLAEGDDIPLSGANSIGTAAGTLVTQRTLELLKFSFPVLRAIWTDFSDVPVAYNQQISTRIIGIPTVSTYVAGTGYAQNDVTDTDVNITINQHKGVQINFDANSLASTLRRLFDEHAPAAAYALAKDMVDYVYALITAANFTNAATIQNLVNFGRPDVIDMGTALQLRGVPMGAMNRTLLLYSTWFANLAKDQALVSLAAFQKAAIIEDGVLPNVHGFKVVDAPNLPRNAATNLVGCGFSKSALALATRLPNDYSKILPGASYGNVDTVQNEDGGIAVMQVQYVNHDTAAASQRIAVMYGAAKGQANALQLLTDQ
jgi:hypothetical protein